MLTRLKVNGFKNLVDVDVRFGPFTCIAGANGVGKSNLFDAIAFLSALADKDLLAAASSVRDEEGRSSDVRSLFTRWGDQPEKGLNTMSFEVEMIVPREGFDDLGQRAEAAITFLRYQLRLGYRESGALGYASRLVIEEEELEHINVSEAYSHLWFEHRPAWRRSVIEGRRTSKFISTEEREDETRIVRHQDKRAGRPYPLAANQLPRTVLSTANASESPTAFMARREMRSWRLLQLEPSALRRPDPFTAPTRLGLDGSNLPATLYRLSHGGIRNTDEAAVYARVVNRLASLIDDVRRVRVKRDETRELYTAEVEDRTHTTYPARALSDGTLRFLALAVLELDPLEGGVLCLEEPENGIHPARIPAMLDLLQAIAVDATEPIGEDNPLRQVIVNTHSPAVVQLVPEDSLVVAESVERSIAGERITTVSFGALPETWRVDPGEKRSERAPDAKAAHPLPLGRLLAYLSPVVPEPGGDGAMETPTTKGKRRVIDRRDIRQYVLFDE